MTDNFDKEFEEIELENMNENQLLVSFELICLLKWILENEDNKMYKIVQKALSSGLQKEINKKIFMTKEEMLYSIQPVLFEFFDMLEAMLAESIGQNAVKKVLAKNLMPSIDKIDSSVCDNETVQFCIEKTALKLDNGLEKNSCSLKKINKQLNANDIKKSKKLEDKAKKILMDELLKNWKPKEKAVIN